MRCTVEEIFMRWIVEKIIISSQILNYLSSLTSSLPSDIKYKLVIYNIADLGALRAPWPWGT